MNFAVIIGLAAGACTTISFLPQVLRTFSIKETKDISLSMYIIFVTGIVLWMIYGIMTRDLPVILANLITFILAGAVLILKIRYG